MSAEPLTCRELVEIVTDYLDGALPPEDRARFEAHLGICPGCHTYVEQIRQTVQALGKLSEDDIPPHTREELLAAFRNWKRGVQ